MARRERGSGHRGRQRRRIVARTGGASLVLCASLALASLGRAAPASQPAKVSASSAFRALPDPVAGRNVNGEVVDGDVLVKRPGSSRFVRLTRAASIPVGSEIDTTRGGVRIEAAQDLQGTEAIAEFWAGRFKLTQARAPQPVTELALRGGDLARCPAADGRELWGRGIGRWRTRGRYAAASVRGTWWVVEDRCDGTLTRVVAGRVDVEDFGRRRTVTLTPGRRYLARAPRTSG